MDEKKVIIKGHTVYGKLDGDMSDEITLDRAIVIGVRDNKELDLYPIGITFDDLQNIFVFISDLVKK